MTETRYSYCKTVGVLKLLGLTYERCSLIHVHGKVLFIKYAVLMMIIFVSVQHVWSAGIFVGLNIYGRVSMNLKKSARTPVRMAQNRLTPRPRAPAGICKNCGGLVAITPNSGKPRCIVCKMLKAWE